VVRRGSYAVTLHRARLRVNLCSSLQSAPIREGYDPDVVKNQTSALLVTAVLLGAVTGATYARGIQAKPTQSGPIRANLVNVNAGATVMADFVAKVEAYAKLRSKLGESTPRRPDESTPEQIDQHQRALALLVVAARKGARQGDLFSPEMRGVVHALMAQVFKNPQDRAELRASIAEDNEGGVKLVVNGRYPDTIPLATMPPDVLKNLPPLPKEIEYRFVGESLILLDVTAHLIVDFMSFALPKG
jgi:hypothetical protein